MSLVPFSQPYSEEAVEKTNVTLRWGSGRRAWLSRRGRSREGQVSGQRRVVVMLRPWPPCGLAQPRALRAPSDWTFSGFHVCVNPFSLSAGLSECPLDSLPLGVGQHDIQTGPSLKDTHVSQDTGAQARPSGERRGRCGLCLGPEAASRASFLEGLWLSLWHQQDRCLAALPWCGLPLVRLAPHPSRHAGPTSRTPPSWAGPTRPLLLPSRRPRVMF